MFLDKVKDFFTIRKVKKSIANSIYKNDTNKIKTVGIVIDETIFEKKEALIKSLVNHGILKEHISLLLFDTISQKNDAFTNPTFNPKDFTWSATFSNPYVNEFIAKKHDLLISYYTIEKTPLLQVTNLSKARFKTGFASIDNRVNHFIISTKIENHTIYMDELLKYLKILNKI